MKSGNVATCCSLTMDSPIGRLEDMEVFARVVEAESFTGVAQRLAF